MKSAPTAPAHDDSTSDAATSRIERIVAKCLPSLADVIFVCVLLMGVLALRGRVLGIDGDVGWNLRLGEIVLSDGLPRTEPLLQTMHGQPTVHWEWLAQVLYALAARAGSLTAVVAVASILIAFTLASLFGILRRNKVPIAPALLLTLCGLILISITWTARAQLLSIPLTLWWTEWLWRYWRDGQHWRLWCFPLTMALWANLHGGFLGGLMILATAVAVAWLFPARRGNASPRDVTLALLASCLATLCTPWGLALYGHILTYARNPLIAEHTQEYQSPDFHQFYVLLFAGLLAALIALWFRQVASAHRITTDEPSSAHIEPLAVAHTIIWSLLALSAVRFLPVWAVVVLPIIGRALVSSPSIAIPSNSPTSANILARPFRLIEWGRPRLAAFGQRLEQTDARVGTGWWSLAVLVVLAVTLLRGGQLPGTSLALPAARFDARTFPVDAATRLRNDGLPAGNGFSTYEWGGYLEYALPAYSPFIDSRSDVYSEGVLRDYMTVIDLESGWQATLRRYRITWALLPSQSPLAQVLARSPGWRCQPEDRVNVAVLCLRTS